MMVVVADNEHPREHDPVAPPPAVREPTDITPEQVRQFQEFQRFQELMRDQADKGFPPADVPPGFLQPWGPPPPKESFGKRLLKSAISKIVTGLVVLAILTLGAWLAIDYFLGEDRDQPPASQTGGGKAETNLIFETEPRLAVWKVYEDIAQGDPKSACGRFTDDARAEFTRNMSQYGASCTEIVTTIHQEVDATSMKAEYGEPWIPASAVVVDGTSATVSSCAIEVVGGPRLGLLTLSEIPKSEEAGGGDAQWIVSGHQTEPACPTTSTGPTS